MPNDEDRPWPVIIIPEPECHKCGAKTFVMFKDLPWCRDCYLAEIADS